MCVRLFTTEATNWHEAKGFCESAKMKSKLVSIKDPIKYDFIRKWSEGLAGSDENSFNKFWVGFCFSKLKRKTKNL